MDKNIERKLHTFFSHYPQHHFKKGETIIASSDKITHVYLLEEGLVQQRIITQEGEEVSVHLFKPLSYFPMMVVMSEEENEFDFVALQNLLLYKAPTEEVLAFLNNNHDVLFDLAKRFAQGINGLTRKIVTLSYTDSHAKVASFIYYFASRLGILEDGYIRFPIHVTHADIASWIGISRETVSRHFVILERKGFISYEDEFILVKDLSKLEKEIHKLKRSK